MMRMSAKLEGYPSMVTKLGKLKDLPTREQKEQIGKIGVDGIKSNFRGNPLGWKANRKSTIRAKGHSRINIGERQGAMRDATDYKITANGIEWINRDKAAVFAEKGTHPHTIRPRRKRGVLAFTGDRGETVFSRQSKHPGTPARPFMRFRPVTVKKIMDVMRRAIRQAFKRGPGTGGPLGKGL